MKAHLPFDVRQVLAIEHERIAARRKAAGLPDRERPARQGNGASEKTAGNRSSGSPLDSHLVQKTAGLPSPDGMDVLNGSAQDAQATMGVAMSGGGIRSGSLGIGFLQTLYRRGVLRHVDYLSTVSGGGYAGAFFASLVADPERRTIDWCPDSVEKSKSGARRLDFLPDESGTQPEILKRLSYAGERLTDSLSFVATWFLGVLLVNAWIVAGLVAVGAAAAWLYRSLDGESSMRWTTELGFSGDVPRAFVFPVAAFCAWLFVTFAGSFWWWRLKAWRVPMFGVLVATLAMSVTMLLVTDDVSRPVAELLTKAPGAQRSDRSQWASTIVQFALAALGGALLPYLNPAALIRSGSPDKSKWYERWIFAVSSRALLFGIPLVAFGFFAQENVSNYNAVRIARNALTHHHLNRFHVFWNDVRDEANADQYPGRGIFEGVTRDAINKKLEQLYHAAGLSTSERLLPPETETKPRQVRGDFVSKVCRESEEELNRDGNRVESLARLFHRGWSTRVQERQQREIERDALAAVLDDQMLSPQFYQNFDCGLFGFLAVGCPQAAAQTQDVAGRPNGTDADRERRDREKQRLLVHARDLEDKFRKLESAASFRPLDKLQLEDPGKFLDKSGTDDPARGLYEELRVVNRDLLAWHYGEVVRPPSIVFAAFVQPKDQEFRLTWLIRGLVAFVVLGFAIDLNKSSLHSYYRSRLASLWINPVGSRGDRVRLKELGLTAKGAPYLLVNGALNLFSRSDEQIQASTARFTMSECFVGSRRLKYARTEEYQDGSLTLADAIAISGAAVSPAVTSNPLLRWLLVVCNFRLGLWLLNPARAGSASFWFPTPLRILWGLSEPHPEFRRYSFVTDGGHDENTGIGALLERRCRLIVALDASQDEAYHFADFLRLIRMARSDYGVQIDPLKGSGESVRLDQNERFLKGLVPDRSEDSKRKGLADRHVLLARITYPKTPEHPVATTGLLVLAKPSLTGDEPAGLRYYPEKNPHFPHDPTVDQFYTAGKFNAYRQLGEHLGEAVCDLFTALDDPGDGGGGAATSLPEHLDESTIDALVAALEGSDHSRRMRACEIVVRRDDRLAPAVLGRVLEAMIKAFWNIAADHPEVEQNLEWVPELHFLFGSILDIGNGRKSVKDFCDQVATAASANVPNTVRAWAARRSRARR